ncbi:tyrosine-type recombinase/integrase [Limnoglobus roseus]|uniref:Site-specific integrase n=1 Tax=Limnoglobus roseus TaxID=2598579 RepID=A0A5C1AE58_9BACT|nr:tyrosine-type recombinase/integrase [Limnoglobus roseus]QEL17521.1 site-specific integrase [Limnoglobus roseus]
MPRFAKPYTERGWYVSRPHGTYLKLSRVEDGMTEARRILKIKLGELEQERGDRRRAGQSPSNLTVAEMFSLFLADLKTNKDDTFRDYQRWCTEFAKTYGHKPARDVTWAEANDFKLRLTTATYVQGKQPPKPYRPKTVNHALIALRRAFNWAIDTDRLPAGRNPFEKVKLLHTEGRRRVATDEEFQTLLRACNNPAFRDVLVAMRNTPTRPQDVYTLEWPMVDRENRLWVIHKHKTAKTAKQRIIPMNSEVEQMLRARAEKYGEEELVFRNRN